MQHWGQSAVTCLAEAARSAHQLVLRRGLLDKQQALWAVPRAVLMYAKSSSARGDLLYGRTAGVL